MEFPTELFRHIEFTKEIPSSFDYSFEVSLFHQPQHLQLQGDTYDSYYILHHKRKKVLAHIHFHCEVDGLALSPAKASFGGLESAPLVDLRIYWKFIEFVENDLLQKNVKEVKMIFPPLIYDLSTYSKIFDVLQKKKYQITNWETGACISIKDINFEEHLDADEKRRLNRMKKEHFVSSKEDLDHLKFIYNFIADCKESKKQSLSMTLAQLQATVARFPDRFKIFSVKKSNQVIAASISIQVKNRTLYNFYSAHHSKYSKYSPVLQLIDHMYSYCHLNGILTLDLGTSALVGIPNFSLLHFKEHTGAVLTPKLSFTKKLS